MKVKAEEVYPGDVIADAAGYAAWTVDEVTYDNDKLTVEIVGEGGETLKVRDTARVSVVA